MAIAYHVYANDGRGGAIDYATVVATVPAGSATPFGSFTTGPLAAPSDNLFAVRAFDDATGVEEANTDARVRVVLDAGGQDVSSRPNAVVGLAVRRTIGDASLVSWGYVAAGQGGPPTRFDVVATPSGVADASPASCAVAYVPGLVGYGCRLQGLAIAADWTIRVAAVGATDSIVGPPAAAVLAKPSGVLAPVDALVATASA